ncbi:MAG TPA: TIGR01777 family oxidoreductase [Polyangiaceae bacterium]
MSRIIVTGGTGFIGSAIVRSLLADGHQVDVLGRDAGRIRIQFGSRAGVVLWDQLTGPFERHPLEGCDAVIHLAGAQAVGTRYSPGKKQQIRDSRVKTTRQLVDALRRLERRPQSLLSASAVGFYGPRSPGSELDESAPAGDGFLAELCHEWESAALEASHLGMRVVLLRFGIVFGPGGGAFEAMSRPFRWGIGGPIGNGRQDVSFVSLSDAVRAVRRCLDDSAVKGPVNITAPKPTSSKALASALSKALHRPSFLPVPGAALRLLYGEGAEALITGQGAIPTRLRALGFDWLHPTIEATVKSSLEGPLSLRNV